MIKYRKGDITRHDFQDNDVIIHIVNDQGIMGSGLAYALYKKWPKVKERYLEIHNSTGLKLGHNHLIRTDGPSIFNMVAQTLGGDRPLCYIALCECLKNVLEFLPKNSRIVTGKIGSMGAGGNWDFIKKCLHDAFIKNGHEVLIYEYKE